ncbi:Alpha-amylase isozyme 3A [Picochlorum sp. SENEW3]|nr:Alpha-amylase isozyme 3A [Picochlorum sp. SENEW3]
MQTAIEMSNATGTRVTPVKGSSFRGAVRVPDLFRRGSVWKNYNGIVRVFNYKGHLMVARAQETEGALRSGGEESGSQEDSTYPSIGNVPRPNVIPWEDVIMVQAFGWDSCNHDGHWYSMVEKELSIMKSVQCTHVWLPPPSASVSKEGYLPTQYYDLSSRYGNFDSLVSLNRALLDQGMAPIADVVINHRCADAQDENGVWNTFRDDIPHPGARIDWGPWAITCNDPDFNGKGSRDTGDDYGPSPDLDHSNPKVQEGIIDWLRWLRSHVGFEGWRLDFVKGYDGESAKLYVSSTLQNGEFAVAEYWSDAAWTDGYLEYNQNAMRQRVCDWLDEAEYAAAFDFATKALLQEAVKNCEYDRMMDSEGKAPGLLGWWGERAVTFVDNHDTGSSQQHWPFPSEHVMQGYAYILTHPGIPCIFWEHLMESSEMGKSLCRLAMLRKSSGIKATSELEILAAEKDMYVARIDGKVMVKLGPRPDMGNLLPESGWELYCSGQDWAVWRSI